MKDKKTIKREILGKFRLLNAENGDTLPPHWLEFVYLKKLTGDEKKLFKKAVQELAAVGLLGFAEGPELNLRLTQKGENLIYSGELQKTGRESSQSNSFFHFTGTEV